jgi:hypothetical protein
MITKKQILGELKTNLSPNKRNEILRAYNKLKNKQNEIYFKHRT